MPLAKQHASVILREYHRAEVELIGKAVVLSDGKAGTVEAVFLDELHGLRLSIAQVNLGLHDQAASGVIVNQRLSQFQSAWRFRRQLLGRPQREVNQSSEKVWHCGQSGHRQTLLDGTSSRLVRFR